MFLKIFQSLVAEKNDYGALKQKLQINVILMNTSVNINSTSIWWTLKYKVEVSAIVQSNKKIIYNKLCN